MYFGIFVYSVTMYIVIYKKIQINMLVLTVTTVEELHWCENMYQILCCKQW